MNSAEFDRQFSRLTDHFMLPLDGSRETIAVDWFSALEHYHIDAMERGVTELIRTRTDRFWPPLSTLLTAIKSRMAGMDHTRDKCPTCGGSTWIEAAPWKSNGRVYTGFQRCPDCGVPAPPYKAPEGRQELTAAEYAMWKAGTLTESPVPVSKPNRMVLEVLKHINPTAKGRMVRAIEGAPKAPEEEIA